METRLKVLMLILSFVILLLGGWMFLVPIASVKISGAAMVFLAGFSIAFWMTRKESSG